MFTGIVSEVGEAVSVELQGGSARITVRGGPAVTDAADGDSVSVNGVAIETPDVISSNGVTHVIGSLLMPPSMR